MARVNAGRHEQLDAPASEEAEEGQGRHSPVPTPNLYVPATHVCHTEREFFIDKLLDRVQLIIEMIFVDRPCAMGIWISFSR